MKSYIACSMAALGLLVGCGDQSSDTLTSDGGSMSSPPLTQTENARETMQENMAGLQLADLPPAVRNTVQSHAGAAEIAGIDKETRTGRVIYEISFKDEGLNPKIHVAEDGSLVESDLHKADSALGAPDTGAQIGTGRGAILDSAPNMTFSDLPPAVQKVVQERAPNAQIADIDKETRTGRLIYEIQFKDEGLHPRLHVAEDGSVVEDELKEERTNE
jgi:hypothetical protein